MSWIAKSGEGKRLAGIEYCHEDKMECMGARDMRYRWFDEEERQRKGMMPLEEPEGQTGASSVKKRRVARMELFSAVIAAGLFLYGLATEDIPLLYLSAAFFLNAACPFAPLLGEPFGPFLANLLRGFSIVLFFGAFFLAFF